MLRTLVTAATLMVLSACASATAPNHDSSASRDCFRTTDVRGFGVYDEHRVRVTVGASHHYLLTIAEDTRDIDWTQALAIRSPTSFICTGNGAGVDLYGGDIPRRYVVRAVERAPDSEPAQEGS